MHLAFSGEKRRGHRQLLTLRLLRVSAGDSPAFRLLEGCPVVMANGPMMGTVDGLVVDAALHKPRFVTVRHSHGKSASLIIPWHLLYFDSALGQLVFGTCA